MQKYYRIFGVIYKIAYTGCYEVTDTETNQIVMISLNKNPHVKDIIRTLELDCMHEGDKHMRVKNLNQYVHYCGGENQNATGYDCCFCGRNKNIVKGAASFLSQVFDNFIFTEFEGSLPQFTLYALSGEDLHTLNKAMHTNNLVINDQYLVYQKRSGVLVLVNMNTGGQYEFYTDFQVPMYVNHVRDAIEEHLDYLNEHQYIENVIPVDAYDALMGTYEAIID